MKKVSLAAFLFLVHPSLFPAAHAQFVSIGGEGTVQCGKYLETRRKDNDLQSYIYATWVSGFLSGYNVTTSGKPVTELPNSDTVLAYLDKHCKANPLDRLIQGACSLLEELGGSKN